MTCLAGRDADRLEGMSEGRPPSNMRWCSLRSQQRLLCWQLSGMRLVMERCCVSAGTPFPIASPPQVALVSRRTCSCTDRLAGGQSNTTSSVGASERGQATVEAAVLLPSVMLLLALLLQPACLLYTRMVMESAAAECVRTLATASQSDAESCKRLIQRRLQAIPEASMFHCGGSGDWKIDLGYAEGSSEVSVAIAGHLRPLPLLGITARMLGKSEGSLVRIEVKVTERVRPAWLGGSYGSWQEIWS